MFNAMLIYAQAAAMEDSIGASEPEPQEVEVEKDASKQLSQTLTCHNNVRAAQPGTSAALGCTGSQDGDTGRHYLSRPGMLRHYVPLSYRTKNKGPVLPTYAPEGIVTLPLQLL